MSTFKLSSFCYLNLLYFFIKEGSSRDPELACQQNFDRTKNSKKLLARCRNKIFFNDWLWIPLKHELKNKNLFLQLGYTRDDNRADRSIIKFMTAVLCGHYENITRACAFAALQFINKVLVNKKQEKWHYPSLCIRYPTIYFQSAGLHKTGNCIAYLCMTLHVRCLHGRASVFGKCFDVPPEKSFFYQE